MGGGPTKKQHEGQPPPESAGGNGGGAGETEEEGTNGEDSGDPCEEERRITFQPTEDRSPEPGTRIRLEQGNPIRVVDSEGVVGTLINGAADQIKECLSRGYEMTGTITHIDDAAGEGTAQVKGSKE